MERPLCRIDSALVRQSLPREDNVNNTSLNENIFFSPQKQTLFLQVSNALSQLISEEKWTPGEMLPSETELAKEFSVSQGTMRRALNLLVEKGILIRRQGRGTFVSDFKRNEKLFQRRYVKFAPDDPLTDEALPTTSKLLFFVKVSPPLEIQSKLCLEPQDMVIHAGRALLASSGLVTFDEIWASETVFSKLTEENLMKHEEKLLYSFYQSELGVSIGRVEETIKAALLPSNLCFMFKLPDPTPVIEINRLAYSVNDKPIEYRHQLCVTRKYHYTVSGQFEDNVEF